MSDPAAGTWAHNRLILARTGALLDAERHDHPANDERSRLLDPAGEILGKAGRIIRARDHHGFSAREAYVIVVAARDLIRTATAHREREERATKRGEA